MDQYYLITLTEALNKTFAWSKYREGNNMIDPVHVSLKTFYGKSLPKVVSLLDKEFNNYAHRNIAFICQDKTHSTAIIKNRLGKYRLVRMPTSSLTKFYEDLKVKKQ